MGDRDPSTDDLPTRTLEASEGGAKTLGDYRVVGKLGQGGMGEVYLAEQLRPVRRQVALKLIKAGMDTAEVLARFEAERQALARMSHPNIAQVFEAGATPEGRPYFAMEYVPGMPITEYCDRHRLSIRERVELFMPVCHGIQHAHQKGIIHRDVKPTNVLVTLQSGEPTPKIIDFGVAKATSGRLGEWTVHTAIGVPIGTPTYMSPEQANLSAIDVDTRTDIYALGALLYELLSGSPPFDPKRLSHAGLSETVRILRDEEPPRPSARLTTRSPGAARAAELRSADRRALRHRLHGDLDRIVMKTLHKDRTRRYDSAKELAEDLLRYLRHEPVVAGPPGTAYRLRKFVRRHRLGVASAAAITGALVAGLAVTTVALDHARTEAEKARVIGDFLTRLLAAPDPAVAGREVKVVDVLDRAADRIDESFSDRPEIAAELHRTLGRTYLGLGVYPTGSRHLASAVALYRRALGEDHPETLESLEQLAAGRFYEGRLEEAETISRDVLERRRRTLGQDAAPTLDAESLLGSTLNARGRYAEAETLFRELVAANARAPGDREDERLTAMNNLALALRKQNKTEEAERIYRQVLETRRRLMGDDDPQTLISMANLAYLLQAIGRYPEAEALHREALERKRRVLGEAHPDALTSMNGLALVLRDSGRPAEAAALYEQLFDIVRKGHQPAEWRLYVYRSHYAGCLALLGRRSEAEAIYEEALAGLEAALGPDHPQTVGVRRHIEELRASPDPTRVATAPAPAVSRNARRVTLR